MHPLAAPAFLDLSLGLASFGSRKLSLSDGRAWRVARGEQSPHSTQAVISHFLASQGQSRPNALAPACSRCGVEPLVVAYQVQIWAW